MSRLAVPDWQHALTAQAEILTMMKSSYGKGMAKAWCDDRFKKYGFNATTPSATAFENVVEDLLAIEPLYVTEEMQELTYHAMETFDSSEPLHFDDMFMPSGFALLEHPFFVIDNVGKRLGWRAFSWRYVEMPFVISHGEDPTAQELAEANIKPCLRMMLWSRIDDEDDYPLSDEDKQIYIGHGIRWGVAHATTIPLEFVNDFRSVTQEGDVRGMWLTFFRVMQRLMAERITLKEPRQAHRAAWREAKRKGLDLRRVIVVELRRRQEDHGETQGNGQSNYSHQWIVHGFWRMQPYPKSGTVRQKYIADYVKGPKDKPLVVKNRVWKWDR